MKKIILLFLLIFCTIYVPGMSSLKDPESNKLLRVYIENIVRQINKERESSIHKTKEVNRLNEIANRFNLKPSWLLKVFLKESNLDPKKRNVHTNATGLIQFMPSTANYLETTVNKLVSTSIYSPPSKS